MVGIFFVYKRVVEIVVPYNRTFTHTVTVYIKLCGVVVYVRSALNFVVFNNGFVARTNVYTHCTGVHNAVVRNNVLHTARVVHTAQYIVYVAVLNKVSCGG